jgi:hypothetical protein
MKLTGRKEQAWLERLLDDRDRAVRLLAVKFDGDAVDDVALVRGNQRLAFDAFMHRADVRQSSRLGATICSPGSEYGEVPFATAIRSGRERGP